MEKLFNPRSIVLFGLSRSPRNIVRLIRNNLRRWEFKGRLYGVHPQADPDHPIDGVPMFQLLEDLPEVPDLAVILIPAQYIPATVAACAKVGVPYAAVLSGGFSEFGDQGRRWAKELAATVRRSDLRLVGPNCLAVAATDSGICLPFQPLYKPKPGGLSFITQSGGMGVFLWNLLENENVGLAKFASIGNKLDLDEVDFLAYFGRDPETQIIGMYLENISRGEAFLETAAGIDKPIVVLKANTTPAGQRAAVSHTASLANDDDIVDTAFERAGIIRIANYADFIAVTKAFQLPPLKGNRLMVMSPAGGMAVHMADLCDRAGFTFADPGPRFYEGLQQFSNAGIINFSNPLDMGDIYDIELHARIFDMALHHEAVDGAIYLTQRPHMPREGDTISRIFFADIAQPTQDAVRSSGKPLGVCLYGPADSVTRIKNNLALPIFNSPEEMIFALKCQIDFHARQQRPAIKTVTPEGMDFTAAANWLAAQAGAVGEAALQLLELGGIPVAPSRFAGDPDSAVTEASRLGYPVALKVDSPDALHKSEAGGVILGLETDGEVITAFGEIRDNLAAHCPGAQFNGVRVMRMAPPGLDMFIGGKRDAAFGPVVYFGYGGIHVEIFKDVANDICPASTAEIEAKLARLDCEPLLQGFRGAPPAHGAAFIEAVVRVSHLLYRFPQIAELDINPLRVFEEGQGVMALDARGVIHPNK